MPHYKCEACKVRLDVSGSPAEGVGELCPECGSLLEPVAALAELVGLRALKPPNAAADAPQSAPHRPIADLLDQFVARRTAVTERDRRDAERRLDDSDRPEAVAVALPPPHSYL